MSAEIVSPVEQRVQKVADGLERIDRRRPWSEPRLERRESLPRVTNGFAGSFNP